MDKPMLLGETTITGRSQISLPARSLRVLGWTKGDRLIVETLGDGVMVLIRRPASWTDTFAGRMTDVFGTHEDTLGYLEGERRSWAEER